MKASRLAPASLLSFLRRICAVVFLGGVCAGVARAHEAQCRSPVVVEHPGELLCTRRSIVPEHHEPEPFAFALRATTVERYESA